MQKVDWRFIENFVDPELFQKAYDAVEEGLSQWSLQENEGNIYTLKSTNDQLPNPESEVEIKRKYLGKVKCYCDQARESKWCVHTIATIILYRRKYFDSLPTTIEGEKPTQLASRVSIPAILNQIPKDDLDRFLQRYARTNKQFGQALKLHFASRIQVLAPDQKYNDLIKSMTRLIPNADGKIPKQALQSLFWISEELMLQADDLIATENATEAFAIAYELLQKYQSIYRKIDVYLGEYEKHWIIIHQKLRIILDSTLAPDFRLSIHQKLYDLFIDPGYPFLHSPHNLFEILMLPPASESHKEILETMLKKMARKEMNPIPLLAWIKMAMKIQDESKLIEALHTVHDTSRWLAAIEALAATQKDMASKVGKWLVLRTKDEFWKLKIMDRLWAIYPDDPDSIVYALTLLAHHPDDKYIQFLLHKQVSLDMIAETLLESTHVKALPLTIQFYIDTNQWTQAKLQLEKHLNLELLKSFTQKMYVKEEDWLFTCYKLILSQYLNTHVGPIPAGKIQSILNYLHLIRAKSLADQLQKWIKKNYQDHFSLTENI